LEIITDEPLKILSQLVIPFFLVIITGLIPTIIKIYLSAREKNQYIKLLEADFPIVEKFLGAVGFYKIFPVYFLSYWLFFGGVVIGFIIEIIFVQAIIYIFSHIINIHYIENVLNLSSGVVLLNGVALCYSCSFFISILFVILIFYLWYKFLKLKKLFIPKINKDGMVEISSWFVSPSFWVFIGIVFGLNIIIFLYDQHTNVLYPGFDVIVYMLGFLVSFILIVRLYYFAKFFNDDVIRSILNVYKYGFPYIKIKTESGEVEGQLRDIINKSLVTLSDKNELKIVPWDKIQTMEASNPNKNGQLIFDSDSIK